MAVISSFAVGLLSFRALAASPELPILPGVLDHETRASVPAYSFTNRTTIYAPVNNQTVGYPRLTELSDGSVLVACTLSGNYPAYFPIFKSTDGGVTWSWLSNVGVGGDSSIRPDQPRGLMIRQSTLFLY